MSYPTAKAALGLAIGAGLLAASASPAAARDRDFRRDHTGAIIGAGILGVALGAAIASDSHPGYYYRAPAYYARPYYAPPPPPVVYYPAYPARYYYGYDRDWRWHHAGRYGHYRGAYGRR